MKLIPLLLLLSLAAWGANAQLPVNANKFFVSNNKYEISLVDEKPLTPGDYLFQYLFETKSKATGKVSQLTIGNEESRFRALTNLHLFNNIFIVEGELKRASSIAVVDLKKSRQVDMFWCYHPSPSPSKRFWVYQKFFPYHGVEKSVTSLVVLVYDMTKSPEKNRMPVTDRGYTLSRKEGVGFPIYPESHVAAKAYLILEQHPQNWDPAHLHSRTSPFLWSHDEQQVVFLCTHHAEKYRRPHVVRVDLSAGVDRPRIFERSIIMTSDFLKTANPGMPPRELDGSLREYRHLNAEKIEWLGSNQVVIRPSRHLMKEEIILPVP